METLDKIQLKMHIQTNDIEIMKINWMTYIF